MPGLAPGIDVFSRRSQDVNGRQGLQSQFGRSPPYASCIAATGLCIMTRSRHRIRIAALAALPLLLLLAGPAGAQEQRSSGGFLDNLFSRGDQPSRRQAEPPSQAQGEQPRVAQADSADVGSRIDRLESALRQLTGTIEDLQHQNQVLQMQLQADADRYRVSLPATRLQGRAAGGGATARDVDAAAGQRAAGRHARQPRRRVQSGAASECARRTARARQRNGRRSAAECRRRAAGRRARRP